MTGIEEMMLVHCYNTLFCMTILNGGPFGCIHYSQMFFYAWLTTVLNNIIQLRQVDYPLAQMLFVYLWGGGEQDGRCRLKSADVPMLHLGD